MRAGVGVSMAQGRLRGHLFDSSWFGRGSGLMWRMGWQCTLLCALAVAVVGLVEVLSCMTDSCRFLALIGLSLGTLCALEVDCRARGCSSVLVVWHRAHVDVVSRCRWHVCLLYVVGGMVEVVLLSMGGVFDDLGQHIDAMGACRIRLSVCPSLSVLSVVQVLAMRGVQKCCCKNMFGC